MNGNQLGYIARRSKMQTPRLAFSLAMTALLLGKGRSRAEGEQP